MIWNKVRKRETTGAEINRKKTLGKKKNLKTTKARKIGSGNWVL